MKLIALLVGGFFALLLGYHGAWGAETIDPMVCGFPAADKQTTWETALQQGRGTFTQRVADYTLEADHSDSASLLVTLQQETRKVRHALMGNAAAAKAFQLTVDAGTTPKTLDCKRPRPAPPAADAAFQIRRMRVRPPANQPLYVACVVDKVLIRNGQATGEPVRSAQSFTRLKQLQKAVEVKAEAESIRYQLRLDPKAGLTLSFSEAQSGESMRFTAPLAALRPMVMYALTLGDKNNNADFYRLACGLSRSVNGLFVRSSAQELLRSTMPSAPAGFDPITQEEWDEVMLE